MPSQFVEYISAPPAVRAVFDDIKKTRKVEDVNNFWKLPYAVKAAARWSRSAIELAC